ncbi:Uncharacterised protein [Serratia ficaria]|uniref:hypothetical protein n=1 Tax=Serratia ficaria TaxID=61651 RepID=UPI0021843791|nr:hypothetical protein [Serratia ficaria]CAI2533899.1 Uncharacterised protein [Serratia ficaria]
MTLKEKLKKIQALATVEGLDDDFIATAILFWIEWDTSLELTGNGWLDDDSETYFAINESDASIDKFKAFLERAGVSKW